MSAPEPIRAAILEGVRHGFFTRAGGVSRGIYAGLNCGRGSRDDPAHAAENRRRAAAALGAAPGELLSLYQIHSAEVARVSEPWPDAPESSPRADAMVTDRPGLVLGILTADCAPVLLADVQAGVIGAAHAGWRGALSGVIENTLAAMETLGADRARIRAAVGPCIAQASYEVGREFYDCFIADDAAHDRFFVPGDRDRLRFDLKGFCAAKLDAAGIAASEILPHDTYADAGLFFSHRRGTHRGEADYGRLLSAIGLIE